MVEPNTCIRGCCTSSSIPLHLPPSSYSLLFPIARGHYTFFLLLNFLYYIILYYIITHSFSFTFTGAESVVYEGTLNGAKVAVKKPILSLSQHINDFHKQLQLLWFVFIPSYIFIITITILVKMLGIIISNFLIGEQNSNKMSVRNTLVLLEIPPLLPSASSLLLALRGKFSSTSYR